MRLLISFFILGLSFGLGPCLASCGPLLVSYIAGAKKNIFQAVLAYLLFSLSRIAAYIVLGLAFFVFGQLAVNYLAGEVSRYLYLAAGLFVIFIGALIAFGKNMNHRVCQRLNETLLKKGKMTVLLLGFFIGILPCGPLVSAFGSMALIAKNWGDIFSYSVFFGLGTVFSPLLLLVIFTGLIPSWMKNANLLIYRIFNFICGIIMVILGIDLMRKFF